MENPKPFSVRSHACLQYGSKSLSSRENKFTLSDSNKQFQSELARGRKNDGRVKRGQTKRQFNRQL